MGNAVGGLRDSFYRDLRREYRDEGVNSLLYRYFWTEAVTELLEEYVPQLLAECPIKPENSGQIRARLGEVVRGRRELLLRPAPEKKRGKKGEGGGRERDRQKRRDFWEELWLNDAGYQAHLISDTDYYLWLVEVLAAHDLYYKDTGMWDGRLWLIRLLKEGWLGAGEPRVPGLWHQKGGKSVLSTAQIGADLRQLSERIKTNREGIAGRLHALEEEGEDYLPWLTEQLERMALHIRIRDWLQNSGYPLIKQGDMSARFSAKKSRKQDFSMRLLDAYCASGRGAGLLRQEQSAAAASGWRLTSDGFCLPDENEVEELRKALEQSGETFFYIPLAVDLQSGCVLFLAGKDIYEEVYQEEEKRWSMYHDRMEKELSRAWDEYENARKYFNDSKNLKAIYAKKKAACEAAEKGRKRAELARTEYKASPSRLCFDFLRLDRGHLNRFGENPAGAFRLRPVFHERAKEEDFQAALTKFIDYCKGECDHSPRQSIPREAIREYNYGRPSGIPESFRWAYEQQNRESLAAFHISRSRPLERPGSCLPQTGP